VLVAWLVAIRHSRHSHPPLTVATHNRHSPTQRNTPQHRTEQHNTTQHSTPQHSQHPTTALEHKPYAPHANSTHTHPHPPTYRCHPHSPTPGSLRPFSLLVNRREPTHPVLPWPLDSSLDYPRLPQTAPFNCRVSLLRSVDCPLSFVCF
jgi:hypothetical protein